MAKHVCLRAFLLRRFQPVPEEWNEERDDEIVHQSLWDLRLAMCRTWHKLYKGTVVLDLPPGAECETEMRRIDAFGNSEAASCTAQGCRSKQKKFMQVGWGLDPCSISNLNLLDSEKIRADANLAESGEMQSRHCLGEECQEVVDRPRAATIRGADNTSILGLEAESINDVAFGARQGDSHSEDVPWIQILSPVEGTTVLQANLSFDAGGVNEGQGWSECCWVEVYFNREEPVSSMPFAIVLQTAAHPLRSDEYRIKAQMLLCKRVNDFHYPQSEFELVARVSSVADLPILLDRDRDRLPYGPSWHTVFVRLHRQGDINVSRRSAYSRECIDTNLLPEWILSFFCIRSVHAPFQF